MNSEQNRPDPEMVSSTGGLGLERRSYDRLYWNWRGRPIANVNNLVSAFSRLLPVADREGITRTVFRGLITEQAYEDLSRGSHNFPAGTEQEVALRINNCWTEDPYWLVVLGANTANRRAIAEGNDFYPQLSYHAWVNNNADRTNITVKKSIEEIQSYGFRIRSEIPHYLIESLWDLWGETFEWTQEGIVKLQERLQDQAKIPQNLREVWFSGVEHNGRFVSAATAERIDFKRERKPLTLVESTEWATDQNYRRKGLMRGTVSHMNAQILRDLGPETVIYAECNWMTKAFRVGHAAGLAMPQPDARRNTHQILRQNVAVGDRIEPSGLRDFVFMYLPQDEIMKNYSFKTVDEVLQMANI